MSHFYSSIQGNRGEATRCGTKDSGIRGHIRGWDIGVRVHVFNRNGVDEVRVYKTSGSNGEKPDVLLASFDNNGNGTPKFLIDTANAIGHQI
ncbi:hypothetical protein ACFL3R_00770 [Thermodesulfobacteriota bacterium]